MWRTIFPILIFCGWGACAPAQVFTVQVGEPAAPPQVILTHSDTWRYHKGTNYPGEGWQTVSDSTLGADWLSGAGGFGYSADTPNEVAVCQTILSDMQYLYTTLYMRRQFEVAGPISASAHLILTMDWDDGFVAWLDGVELQRANVLEPVGTEPTNSATAPASHESSRGTSAPVYQPVQFDLGEVGSRLAPGPHVLAILGINNRADSSDLVQVADLSLGNGSGGVVDGKLLAIVRTNSVALNGSMTWPGVTRITVDGLDASLDLQAGKWSNTVTLAEGFNRLLIQGWNNAGVPVLATNRDVVVATIETNIGGLVTGSLRLSPSNGVVHVTNSLFVPPGAECTIEPGTVLLLKSGASIQVTNGTLHAAGTPDAKVYFLPDDGASVWGGLIGAGTSARLIGKFIETCAGRLELFNGASGEFEDCYIHDYTVSSPAIIHTLGQPNHTAMTLRRCHVARYHELLLQLSTNRFEESLFEYPSYGEVSGDGIDFDASEPGSWIRRCTVRHGPYFNVDALDMGDFGGGVSCRGLSIEDCLLYHFSDKGISLGANVEATISNTFMHTLETGIAVKDYSVAGIYNCSIVSNQFGFRCYNRNNPGATTGGGFITNSFNNILAGNVTNVLLLNGSTLTATYSDFEGSGYPGVGNISADPMFVFPALFDCRVQPASPTRAAGVDGADLGVSFPVGCPMAPSHPQITRLEREGTNAIVHFWADSDHQYALWSTDTLAPAVWTKVADVYPTPLPRQVGVTNQVPAGLNRFYRLSISR